MRSILTLLAVGGADPGTGIPDLAAGEPVFGIRLGLAATRGFCATAGLEVVEGGLIDL